MQYEQTEQERYEVLADYFRNSFQADFPHLEQVYDANGDVLCGPSHIVLCQVWPAEPFLKRGLVQDRIRRLDLVNLLVRKPQVVEKIVEVERQPTAQIAKAKKDKFEKEHSQGFHNTAKNNRRSSTRRPVQTSCATGREKKPQSTNTIVRLMRSSSTRWPLSVTTLVLVTHGQQREDMIFTTLLIVLSCSHGRCLDGIKAGSYHR